MSICATGIVVQIFDGAAYQTVAGLKSRSITFNSETVDVTNADSTGKWRELLDGCGVKSASVSGSGIAKDDTALTQLRAVSDSQVLRLFRFIIPTFGQFQGSFKVTQLQLGGEYNGAVDVDLSAESSGALTFTAS